MIAHVRREWYRDTSHQSARRRQRRDGTPPDERDLVLESSYARGDGSGSGLAIVDAIAGANGWTVGVTGSETGGERFEFRDGGR